MSEIEVSQDLTTIKIQRHNLVDIKNGAVVNQIDTALRSGVLKSSDLDRKIVFDSLCEGHGPREMLCVLESLRHRSWFNPDNIVFLHNSLDHPPSTVKHVSWFWYMVNHSNWLHNLQEIGINWALHKKDRWFLCLMRRPSHRRGLILKNIFDNFDPCGYRVSYASMLNYRGFDEVARIEIPLLLDGPTPGDQQHRAKDPRVFGCLINLIVETSCQESGDHYWSSRFITEKTFKCFGWQQIPIWFAAPGHVQAVRELGFDVFDDVFDHGKYDDIKDPDERMTKVISLLKEFLESQQSEPDEVYQKHKRRLDKNWERLLDLDRQKIPYWSKVIKKIKDL